MTRPSCVSRCVLAALLLASAPILRADEEADRVALRALKALYEQAVNEDKVELLAPHVDPEFTGVMQTSEPVRGMEGLSAYWKKLKGMMGATGRYRVTVATEPAQFFGDLALAHGTTEDVITLPGKEYRFGGQWTAVCRKRDGVWKLYRIHASMDPVGNPFVTDRIRVGRWGFGGALLAVGLVVGGILGRLLARRRAAGATVARP